jgi:hypothetical protein
VETLHLVAVEFFLHFGTEKFFHCGFVAYGYAGFKLVAGGAKSSAAHKVGHQGDILVTHIAPLIR